MTTRVYRVDPPIRWDGAPDEIKRDLEATAIVADDCPWCGAEIGRDDRCSANCEPSRRVDRVDA